MNIFLMENLKLATDLNNNLFFIAEAGVNHNGCLETATEMISVAKECGADAVKFQTFTADSLATKTATQAEYQKVNTSKVETQHAMLEKLELKKEYHEILLKECNKNSIEFMSSPFDINAAEFLLNLGMKKFKIPSGEITNKPFLEYISRLNKPTILSTGMSTIKEINEAISIFSKNDFNIKNLSVLHATSDYPANPLETNMKCIATLREELNCRIGYSDHTQSNHCAIVAASLGATMFEKHFTLDKKMQGPDHKASLEPEDLKHYISSIRETFKILGNGIKAPSSSELKNINIVRKSIVARNKIKKGTKFTKDNLTTKRPGSGISPMQIENIYGKKAPKDFQEDELIEI